MNHLLPIMLFTISSTLTPGPNNLMIMNAGLNFGLKRSLPHYFGICFGFPAMVLIVALGFGAIFLKYVWLKDILKIIGAAYLLYLAWQIMSAVVTSTTNENVKPFSFYQATLFQWINPKAWMMAIGAISLFSITESYLNNALAISGIFFLVCLPCIGLWLFFGTLLQKILKDSKHQKWLNTAMAISLAASVLMMF